MAEHFQLVCSDCGLVISERARKKRDPRFKTLCSLCTKKLRSKIFEGREREQLEPECPQGWYGRLAFDNSRLLRSWVEMHPGDDESLGRGEG